MSNQLNKIVGIVGMSTLLQFSAAAQNATSTTPPTPLQEKAAKSDSSSEPSSSTNPDSNKVALTREAALKARSEAKAETSGAEKFSGGGSESVVATPKINPKNPALNLKVTARESKTDARSFAAPDLDSMGEPQSFQATAYALKGRTRMGTQVRRGVIAADPRVLPLGSVVQLRAGKYSGVYTVHDTGKRIKGNIIDVWVPNSHEARQFGRQRIKLHVLRLGTKGRSKK